MPSRFFQGIFLLLGMLIVTMAILLIAEIRPPHEQCSWEFPKILSCIYGAHDALAGGLLAAAGTIFAGWLAWTAVRDQIRRERAVVTEERLRYLRASHAQVDREVTEIGRDLSYIETLLSRFEHLSENNIFAYLSVLQDSYRHGELVPSTGTSRFSPDVNRCLAGLQTQSDIFQNTPNLTSGPREVLARGIRNRVMELISIAGRARAGLAQEQKKLAELDSRIAEMASSHS